MRNQETTLNIEAVKLYIEREGQECPFCGESNPEGGSFNVKDGSARQEMSCASCENEWIDSYHLASVIHNGKVFDGDQTQITTMINLWNRLRAAEKSTPEGTMGEIAAFIAEIRGDTAPLCGCGCSLHHYDGLLGYEAMVCGGCGQHFPIL